MLPMICREAHAMAAGFMGGAEKNRDGALCCCGRQGGGQGGALVCWGAVDLRRMSSGGDGTVVVGLVLSAG